MCVVNRYGESRFIVLSHQPEPICCGFIPRISIDLAVNDDLVSSAPEVSRVGDASQPVIGGDFGYPPIERPHASFEPTKMQRFLDGEHRAVRELVKEIVTQPEFR